MMKEDQATMQQPNPRSYNFKVVLLGEGAVGKTSIVLRYIDDQFNDKHISTLQASFVNKKLNINGKRVNLAIWDTAGQEKFHALGPIYYRMSNGAVLVYDITDKDSFLKVKSWVRELKKMLGNEVCLMIVGNKIDLDEERNVTNQEAEEYAANVGAIHLSVSAKCNVGIDQLFLQLTKAMIASADEQSVAKEGSTSRTSSLRRRNVLLVEPNDDNSPDDNSVRPRSKCCASS